MLQNFALKDIYMFFLGAFAHQFKFVKMQLNLFKNVKYAMDFTEELQLKLTDLITNVNRLGSSIKEVNFSLLKHEYTFLTTHSNWGQSKNLKLEEDLGIFYLKRCSRRKTGKNSSFLRKLKKPLANAITKRKNKKNKAKRKGKDTFFKIKPRTKSTKSEEDGVLSKDEDGWYGGDEMSDDRSNDGPHTTTRSSSSADLEMSNLSSGTVCPDCDVTWEEFEVEFGQEFAIRSAEFCQNVWDRMQIAKSNSLKLKEMLENLNEIKVLMDDNMQYISPGSRGNISQTFKMAKTARQLNVATYDVLRTYLCAFPPVSDRSLSANTYEESRSFPDAFSNDSSNKYLK